MPLDIKQKNCSFDSIPPERQFKWILLRKSAWKKFNFAEELSSFPNGDDQQQFFMKAFNISSVFNFRTCKVLHNAFADYLELNLWFCFSIVATWLLDAIKNFNIFHWKKNKELFEKFNLPYYLKSSFHFWSLTIKYEWGAKICIFYHNIMMNDFCSISNIISALLCESCTLKWILCSGVTFSQ